MIDFVSQVLHLCFGNAVFEHTVETVSYTHLDVYKRQIVLLCKLILHLICGQLTVNIGNGFAELLGKVCPCLLYTCRCVEETGEKMDSNHRSKAQQIYRLPPLATREFSHIKFFKNQSLLPKQ